MITQVNEGRHELGKGFDQDTLTVERILRAQPLNPFEKLVITPMARFPVLTSQPMRAAVVVCNNVPGLQLTSGLMTMGQDHHADLVDSVSACYGKLDEVIS